MWHDPVTHQLCVNIIKEVANEPDYVKRLERAIKQIAVQSTVMGNIIPAHEFLGTIAMAALYPEDYGKDEG